MIVKPDSTGRYRRTRVAAVAVLAMLATVVLVLTVGVVAPWVPPDRAVGRAGSAVLPSMAGAPVGVPQPPPGPVLGCGGDR